MNLIEELRWRGMVADIMPGTEAQLLKEKTMGYVGFDPTADSLHIGSLVPILLLVHLQKAGHQPIALVGGATGMIGDPSGKSNERNLLDEPTLEKNVAGIGAQLKKFLNFSDDLPNRALLVNNYDWFKTIGFIEFLRDVGKNITVNYMMAKDSVKKRIEGGNGLSYTEFAYQLMQGYDFYWMNETMGCKLQMGGSDQWGNMTTGTELVRRKNGNEAFVFTCPLITKADGGKFGKTETGNIWLDANKTSPYQFYQFWLNTSDEDAQKWIKIFTFLDKKTIEALIAEHQKNPAQRLLQKALAKEVTSFVHGTEALETAIFTTEKLFRSETNIEDFSIADLNALEGVIKINYPISQLQQGIAAVQLLADLNIYPSKSEARKAILNQGISLNKKKITDTNQLIAQPDLLFHQYLLFQKGKKTYYLVECKA